jgi:hypothetical protein
MLGTFHLSRQSQRGIPRRAKIIYTLLFTEEYSERCARYPTVQSQNYILQTFTWCRSSKASAPATSFANSSEDTKALIPVNHDSKSL